MRVSWWVFALSSLCFGCDILSTECSPGGIPADQAHRVTISRGAWGQVWFWKGNFSIRYGCGGGEVRPVERLLLFHAETFLPEDVVASDSPPNHCFFTEVRTPVVDSVRSDSAGFFEIDLAPGQYSLFVREESLHYAKSCPSNRAIGLVEVPETGVLRIQLDINYRAAF